jgi:hypothetical protein
MTKNVNFNKPRDLYVMHLNTFVQKVVRKFNHVVIFLMKV